MSKSKDDRVKIDAAYDAWTKAYDDYAAKKDDAALLTTLQEK